MSNHVLNLSFLLSCLKNVRVLFVSRLSSRSASLQFDCIVFPFFTEGKKRTVTGMTDFSLSRSSVKKQNVKRTLVFVSMRTRGDENEFCNKYQKGAGRLRLTRGARLQILVCRPNPSSNMGRFLSAKALCRRVFGGIVSNRTRRREERVWLCGIILIQAIINEKGLKTTCSFAGSVW